jgi:XRE family transcriptional regulator, regulator of sulfur utilization
MEKSDIPSVGKNILKERKKQKMSIEVLSGISGVSKSMLSQIEQEKSNPTVITAWKIARSLGLSVNDLFSSRDSIEIAVSKITKSPSFFSKDKSIIIEAVSPAEWINNVEMYYVRSKCRGSYESKPHFKGTEELLFVIKGRLKITSGNYSITLSKGETAKYKADLEHSIKNETGKQAEGLLLAWFPKS